MRKILILLLDFVLVYIEKNNKKWRELSIYFIEEIKIDDECVLMFLSLSCNLVLWYELNNK